MIQQKLFPFKLEMTEDKLTSKAGLPIFAEYNHAMGITELADKYLTRPKSNRGFNPSVFINSLVLLLTAGGSCLDDIRELKNEKELLGITGIKTIPEPDTIGDWLRRTGEKDIEGLKKLNSSIIKKIMEKEDITNYTLDIDATPKLPIEIICPYPCPCLRDFLSKINFRD